MNKKGNITTSDYLTIEQFNHLCESLHNDRLFLWELYCRLAFCTAFRASDVLSLRWIDILGKSNVVKTEKKTGKTRLIKINRSVQDKVSELYILLEKPDLEQIVISNPVTAKAYTISYINRLLKQFRLDYRLKIEHFSTHSFRKTFGRYVYETNNRSAESLVLLNDILNHASIRDTRRYIGLRQDEIDGVFDSIKF